MADEPTSPCQGQCLSRTIENFQRRSPTRISIVPLLFVIYINDLLMRFKNTTLVSAHADDLAIACSGRSKIDMTKKLQKEFDKVVKWNDDVRLTFNKNKREIRGLPLSFNAAPTFLGVQYDRQLTFSERAKKVCQAMTKITNILLALGGTTWGWRPVDLITKWLESETDWHRAVIVCGCKSIVEATSNPHQNHCHSSTVYCQNQLLQRVTHRLGPRTL